MRVARAAPGQTRHGERDQSRFWFRLSQAVKIRLGRVQHQRKTWARGTESSKREGQNQLAIPAISHELTRNAAERELCADRRPLLRRRAAFPAKERQRIWVPG